jgi:hypothetical protein
MTDLKILWSKQFIGRVPEDVKKRTIKILNAMAEEQGMKAALAEVCKITERHKTVIVRWHRKYSSAAKTKVPKVSEVSLTVNGIAIKGSIDDITALLRAGL